MLYGEGTSQARTATQGTVLCVALSVTDSAGRDNELHLQRAEQANQGRKDERRKLDLRLQRPRSKDRKRTSPHQQKRGQPECRPKGRKPRNGLSPLPQGRKIDVAKSMGDRDRHDGTERQGNRHKALRC